MIIHNDTVWGAGETINLTSQTVQIAVGATLRIEEGAKVIGGSIEVFGQLVVAGTDGNRVEFDGVSIGYGNYNAGNKGITMNFADYNGGWFLNASAGGGGSLSIANSNFLGVGGFNVWHPNGTVEISNNRFENSMGLSLSGLVNVNNNLFINPTRTYNSGYQSAIVNWDGGVVARYNTFVLRDGQYAAEIADGYNNTSIDLRENYFGTTDLGMIDGFIMDRRDDLGRPSIVEISDPLSEAHPGTPFGPLALRGSNIADNMTGGNYYDIIWGYAGDDSITGVLGDDSIYGGIGSDLIDGGGGGDRLDGYTGNDTVTGGSGNDSIIGGGDNDSLDGGLGFDSIYGGNGADFIDGLADGDSLEGYTGNDTIYGGSGFDRIIGGGDNDSLFGGSGRDYIIGGNKQNMTDGSDVINGGEGSDTVYARNGDDTITGGLGKDLMMGNAGADTFMYESISDSSNRLTEADTIYDFVRGSDKIDLRMIDAFAPTAPNNVFAWNGEGAFNNVTRGEVRYQKFNNYDTINDFTLVYIDNDGDAQAEMVIRLTGLRSLTEADFIL